MNRSNKNMKNVVRKLAACCLLLFAIAGSLVAQNDPQYVIKRRTDAGSSEIHYLAHVKSGDTWVLQDATAFSPNCVWYSGNTSDNTGVNHNYYFIDEGVYHFLSAPLEAQESLSLSDSLPSSTLLRNTEQIYYFYDWDWDNSPIDGAGLARGKQYTGLSEVECGNEGYNWEDGQCWEVYWVEFNNEVSGQYGWRMSSESRYHMTGNSARFRKVTVNESITPVENTGLLNLMVNGTATSSFDVEYTPSASWPLSAQIELPYQYTAYTSYVFEGGTHNYYNETVGGPSSDHGATTPTSPNGSAGSVTSYLWTLTGDGASYLSFNDDNEFIHSSSDEATPTLYYVRQNNTGHQTATLTLTVTYSDGSKQVKSATITVKVECGNPGQLDYPEVTYDHVTVSWYNTADAYKVYWTNAEGEWTNEVEVNNANTYTITGLEYNTTYYYKVAAICSGSEMPEPYTFDFTTNPEPKLLIYGSLFGGGRMANVTGNPEVVIINCDTIGAIYGGNDIAGSVEGTDGSTIVLGVDANDTYATTYNSGAASIKVRVNDVYGGGNGFYAYNGTSFEAATEDYNTATIAPGASVTALSESEEWDEHVWTNSGTDPVTLNIPVIVKTNIKVTNNKVKVDSIFGGAKNAFLTYNDYTQDGSLITVDGGTIMAVYGGNNYGGSQGYAKHHIVVNGTTTNLNPNIENTATTGYGRDFGIRYLFGGGNKVAGSTTVVDITGGQLDTIFGGGNQADVYAANITVQCPLGAYAGEDTYTYGSTYTMAINPANYTSGTISNTAIDTVNYLWDGFSGVYNVRTLFGGSNQAAMNGVPNVNLISGSIGTVYGGGNAGDMLAHRDQTISLDGGITHEIKYGTHVVMDSPNILVDNLYGGCQVSNVDFSTWVEIKNGHVGTVYGGCNVSGDVGSTKVYPDAQTPRTLEYQAVQGGTYVEASGGVIYNNLFAGGNGFYHCNDGICYIESNINYGDPEGRYIGLPIPTHNETYAIISEGATIKGNVYAGGNLAPIGYTNTSVGNPTLGYKPYPQFVGLASVRMSGGTVQGDVYGGGRMASIYGSNEVQVTGGTIGGALYGGNDRLGMVAQITNRVLPDSYNIASDGYTSLSDVRTYVSVTGRPDINTVYGGGNGDYNYSGIAQGGDMDYCNPDNLPIQSNIFVDINIDGYPDGAGHQGGHINTVYGGGNGVTITGFTTVFLNIKGENGGEPVAYDHVGTIFGGNNKGSLNFLPDIVLLKGQVNTVYGGCNKGAMEGDVTIGTYEHVGSLVRLRNEYTVVTNNNTTPPTTHTATPTAKVSGAVYGGCRMNGVTNNSMVIVEGHESNHINAEIFGGSDISGVVGGTSMVVVNGVDGTNGTYLGNVYGGGNGNYKYQNNNVYYLNDDGTVGDLIDEGTATNPIVAPYCAVSRVDMLSGTANNLYAGGYAALSGSTLMNIVGGTVNNRAFGGGNLAGTTTTFNDGTNSYTANGNSNVMVTGGTVNGGVFGGNNLAGSIAGTVNVDILGGTFGSSSTPMADGIFGGGYGEDTETNGDVVVNINKLNVTGAVAPIIYGDVYGGSALGSVNTSNNDNTTTINVLDGFIKQTNSGGGNIYGGGLGQKNGYNGATSDILAKVYGKVYVNIGAGSWNTTLNDYDLSGNATIEGSVYGCNNVNGSPQDSVFVNIYKTAHISSPNNYYPDNVPTPTQTVAYLESLPHAEENFAIKAVYGGGNMAAYLPPLTSDNKPRCSTVHIYGCSENTVYDVYGGGNAADVGTTGANGIAANTRIIIDGGRIHRMFGGGNGYSSATPPNHDDPTAPGYNPGANIYGTASSYVHAGLIDEVYGGANMWGSIDYIDLNLTGEGNCEHEVFGKVFGCANAAPLNHSITTTVECGVGTIGQLYGGSFQAPIGDENNPNANVTLNVYGGVYNQVFGGSKGKNDSSGSVAADIYGNVTLNIFGGTIHDAFGGSDINGTIAGVITVNVLDLELECPLDITNIYGANNLTAYTSNPVSGALPISPVVNVMHVKTDIHGNVYGGAYGADATVTSSPQVNIGYDATTMSDLYTTLTSNAPANYSPTFKAYVTGNVYGGGELAAVVDDATAASTTTVNLLNVNARVQNIFGGGHQAGTANNVVNVINGTVATAVYGGCDAEGTVTGDIEVNILNNLGTPGEDGYTVNVFGGGYGVDTETDGDVTVNFGGTGYLPTLYGNVYGGSALGSVNSDTDDLTKVDLKTGTIHGVVYGGGLGDIDQDVEAYVYGNVEVYANGAIVDTIFGCNDQNGTPTGTVKVTVNDGTVSYVFGGGDLADYTPTVTSSGSGILYSPYVYVTGGTVTDMIFGGGNAADINGNTKVELIGGTIGSGGSANPASIFGGGYGAGTQVNGHVLVNFGGIFTDNATGDEVHTNDLILYGDLYGGSALGDVNTPNGTDGTTVNILNGIINGRVFGGGLGRKAATGVTPIAARVNGDVQVNIGACNGHGCQDEAYDQTNSTYYTGMADLINCDVFGCNNINGSPQDEVRVDVYKTYHGTEGTNPNGAYAINQVFGGGNESDYLYDVNNNLIAKNVNVRIHACDNTIWRTFGGGNAADVYGVVLVIEGGQFEYVFGGGNGEVTAANVGVVNTTNGGGVTTILGGGTISQWFTGSNMNGEIVGGITSTVAEYCGNALVEDYFLGSNMTDYHGDVVATIECDANMPKFVNLYGGCNRAQFYGNIQIDINGGVFYNVFGGSKGWLNDGSTNEESYASNILDYDNGSGTGGNITINVYGGTIGNLFGACNLNGNVQGKITINVEADETNLSCPLYLGNIYGGGNMTDYKPGYNQNGVFVNSYLNLQNGTVNTPEINVKKGKVGGIQTVMLDPDYTGSTPPNQTTGVGYLQYEGNVYGGGNKGDVEAHPIVKIGDKDHYNDWPVTIEGNVYGGGSEGKVYGNTKVVIVPTE